MSAIYKTMTIPSASLGGTNSLPVFRSAEPDSHPKYDDTLTAEEADGLGKYCGGRILPYLVQDRYDRVIKPVSQPVVALENEHLRAELLCGYGGRLYGLYDKDACRELLFRNPVIQPANLAIRDAWLSGGIEWNVGQRGHSVTTSSSVFCAILNDGEGNDFARIYEYERQSGFFWQVDLHLPTGSRELIFYTRIVNPNNVPIPMYWWTNTAVTEDETTRVFASADRALYNDRDKHCLRVGEMPYFPSISDKDLSYTQNLQRSNDFFFQTPEGVRAPWEAVAYGTGAVTFERSTSLLRYRKVFCWGNLEGGRRWKEYLSTPGGGSYIEIQAGIGRSQGHGLTMPANTEWDFTMAMGGMYVDPVDVSGDWRKCRDKMGLAIENRIGEKGVYALHEKCVRLGKLAPKNIVHFGSGWGALEALRGSIPEGYAFPKASMGAEQEPWRELMTKGEFPVSDPVSYMTGAYWRQLMENAPDSWAKYYHLGVMAAEVPDRTAAIALFSRSVELHGGFWPLRAKARLLSDSGADEASKLYRLAATSAPDDVGFTREYLRFLISRKDYSTAIDYYRTLPQKHARNARVLLLAAEAELALGDTSICDNGLFDLSFPDIREGEVSLTEIWYKYEAIKLARLRSVPFSKELLNEVKNTMIPPKKIDFRMSV